MQCTMICVQFRNLQIRAPIHTQTENTLPTNLVMFALHSFSPKHMLHSSASGTSGLPT